MLASSVEEDIHSLFQKARDTMLYDVDAYCAFINMGLAQFDSSDVSILKRQGLAYRALCAAYQDEFELSTRLGDSIVKCSPKDHLANVFAYGAIGGSEQFQGRFQNAADNYLLGLKEAKKGNLILEQGMINNALAFLFYEYEFWAKAVEYAWETERIGLLLSNQGLLASAWHRLHNCFSGDDDPKHIAFANLYQSKYDSLAQVLDRPGMKILSYMDAGWLHLDEGQLDSAEMYYLLALGISNRTNDSNQLTIILGNLGKIYLEKGDLEKANPVFQQIESQLQSSPEESTDLFSIYMLAEYKSRIGQHAEAYHVLKEFVRQDEIFYDDQKRQEMLDFEAKYEHLEQQAEIDQQRLKIKQRTTQRNLAYTGGALFLALGLLGFSWWRRLSLKKEFTQDQILFQTENELTESRMQMMRAQMNPHFLFNSLNSIKHFILQKTKDESAQYISDFAKLMRLNLQNSAEVLIPLEREVAFLKQYLLMEQMRFKEPFEVDWNIQKDIDLDAYKFPPMLIQPYLENAIWHGIRYRKKFGNNEGLSNGKIDIHINVINDGNLVCTIQDNGVGRVKSAEIAGSSMTLKKSMGTKITEDRIAMTNTILDADIRVHTEDLYLKNGCAAGTRVTIYIPRITEEM